MARRRPRRDRARDPAPLEARCRGVRGVRAADGRDGALRQATPRRGGAGAGRVARAARTAGLASFARRFAALPESAADDFHPAADHEQRRLRQPVVRDRAAARDAVRERDHRHVPWPRSPGSAYVLLHHYMGEIDGEYRAWGLPVGGTGAISGAIAAAAREAGCGAAHLVARRAASDGAADGPPAWCSSRARRSSATVVISSADVRVTLGQLLEPGTLPPEDERPSSATSSAAHRPRSTSRCRACRPSVPAGRRQRRRRLPRHGVDLAVGRLHRAGLRRRRGRPIQPRAVHRHGLSVGDRSIRRASRQARHGVLRPVRAVRAGRGDLGRPARGAGRHGPGNDRAIRARLPGCWCCIARWSRRSTSSARSACQRATSSRASCCSSSSSAAADARRRLWDPRSRTVAVRLVDPSRRRDLRRARAATRRVAVLRARRGLRAAGAGAEAWLGRTTRSSSAPATTAWYAPRTWLAPGCACWCWSGASRIGGMAETSEIWPGVRVPTWRTRWAGYGRRSRESCGCATTAWGWSSPVRVFAPQADGTALDLWGDAAKTARRAGRRTISSAGRCGALRRTPTAAARARAALSQLHGRAPVDLAAPTWRTPWPACARRSLRARARPSSAALLRNADGRARPGRGVVRHPTRCRRSVAARGDAAHRARAARCPARPASADRPRRQRRWPCRPERFRARRPGRSYDALAGAARLRRRDTDCGARGQESGASGEPTSA